MVQSFLGGSSPYDTQQQVPLSRNFSPVGDRQLTERNPGAPLRSFASPNNLENLPSSL